ncbi:MAG: hypothetical protein R3F17_11675 [Planctomycetota bacterium]
MQRLFPAIPWPVWLCFALGLGLLFWFDRQAPEAGTRQALELARERVLRYAQEHGRLPADLRAADPTPGHTAHLVDGWGHDLSYGVTSDGLVAVGGPGRDSQAGGAGLDADWRARSVGSRVRLRGLGAGPWAVG